MSARIFEGRLGESMVLCDEGKANLVAGFRINVGRIVGKGTILADRNVDDVSSRWRRGESLLPERFECMARLLWVDREDHAFIAVAGLSAVKPKWFLRPEFDLYDPLRRIVRVHWLETRVKAIGPSVSIGQFGAWGVK